MIRSHHGRTPQIAASAYIDPQAVIIGDSASENFQAFGRAPSFAAT